MKCNSKVVWGLLTGAIFVAVFSGGLPQSAAEQNDGGPVPVEESMHELMEYVFQPAYLRLKKNMSQEPEGKAGWKPVKSERWRGRSTAPRITCGCPPVAS